MVCAIQFWNFVFCDWGGKFKVTERSGEPPPVYMPYMPDLSDFMRFKAVKVVIS